MAPPQETQGTGRFGETSYSLTNITDTGLENLKGMTKLRGLDLGFTSVSDAGLKHLKGLTNLTYLELQHSEVTDAGKDKLQAALPNCKVCN